MKDSFKECIGSRTYVQMVIVLCLTEIGCNLYYWGNNYAYDQIGYEYGTNCIIAGVVECLGYFTLSCCIPIQISLLKKYPGRNHCSFYIPYQQPLASSFSSNLYRPAKQDPLLSFPSSGTSLVHIFLLSFGVHPCAHLHDRVLSPSPDCYLHGDN